MIYMEVGIVRQGESSSNHERLEFFLNVFIKYLHEEAP
jgi:hypothetical protein